MPKQNLCHCYSGRQYCYCCEPLIAGDTVARTAEALMRSRYTAYVIKDVSYLLKTWHLSTRPVCIDPATIPDWKGLQIIHTEAGQERDSFGVVEFEATSLSNKKVWRLHEVSRFTKETGQWFYVDGDVEGDVSEIIKFDKVGRNEACPCGSGKKIKKCCGP